MDAIQRIWAGERDEEALTARIDYNSRAIVLAILAQLSGEAPTPTPPAAQASPPPRGEGAAIARLRQQWGPVIQTVVVAACRGDAEAAAQLEPHLAQLSGQDDWRNLAAALRRVLAGERDPAVLLSGLDATDTLIASEVLRGLGVELPSSSVSPSPALGERGPGGEGSITLDDLLARVAQACRPDAPPGLGEQLYGATRAMSSDPNALPETRALGRALNAVLSGERAPDLAALSPELAEEMRRMLAALE